MRIYNENIKNFAAGASSALLGLIFFMYWLSISYNAQVTFNSNNSISGTTMNAILVLIPILSGLANMAVRKVIK